MPANLEFRLTGGASNSDPEKSLGGIMSNTQLLADTDPGLPLSSEGIPLVPNFFPDLWRDEENVYKYRALDIYNSGDEDAVELVLYSKNLRRVYSGGTIGCLRYMYLVGGFEAYETLVHGVEEDVGDTIDNEFQAPLNSGDDVFGDPWGYLSAASYDIYTLFDIPAGKAQRLWLRLGRHTSVSPVFAQKFPIFVCCLSGIAEPPEGGSDPV